MRREENCEFFDKFNAIDKFAKNMLINGKAVIYQVNKETGFVSWLVEFEGKPEKLFITANEKPPTEVTRIKNGEELEEFTQIENNPIENINIAIPEGFSVISEVVYNSQLKEFEEKTKIDNLTENCLYFKIIKPSEFYIYKIVKKNQE